MTRREWLFDNARSLLRDYGCSCEPRLDCESEPQTLRDFTIQHDEHCLLASSRNLRFREPARRAHRTFPK